MLMQEEYLLSKRGKTASLQKVENLNFEIQTVKSLIETEEAILAKATHNGTTKRGAGR